jgi:uncharacterized protein (DUF58 family)
MRDTEHAGDSMNEGGSNVSLPREPGRSLLKRMRRGAASRLFRLQGRLGIQRYRVTAEGLVLLIFIILVGGAAWHSGTNLLYLVFAVLISVFCSHGFMVWGALRRISVERTVPKHIFAGKPVAIGLTIRNSRRFMSGFAFRLVDYDSDGEPLGAAFISTVPSGGFASANYGITFPRRGLYKAVAIEAVTRFPFGIIERGFRQSLVDELVVYPRIREYASFSRLFVDGMGEFEKP